MLSFCFTFLFSQVKYNLYFIVIFQLYYKLGCSTTGAGIQVLSYKDPYCTERTGGYAPYQLDAGLLQAPFNYCKKCTFNFGTYGSQNQGYYYSKNNKNSFYRHPSPLCGAMWSYKETCNYTCRKNQKKALSGKNSGSTYAYSSGSSSSFSSGFGYNDEYSPMEDFLLWGLSLSGMYFLSFHLCKCLF